MSFKSKLATYATASLMTAYSLGCSVPATNNSQNLDRGNLQKSAWKYIKDAYAQELITSPAQRDSFYTEVNRGNIKHILNTTKDIKNLSGNIVSSTKDSSDVIFKDYYPGNLVFMVHEESAKERGLDKLILELGGVETEVARPDTAYIPSSVNLEIFSKPKTRKTFEEQASWYNQGIFGNKTARWIGGIVAGVGISYGISRLATDDNHNKNKTPEKEQPADVGVSGGREDPIVDSGSVRGGRGDSNNQSGSNRQ